MKQDTGWALCAKPTSPPCVGRQTSTEISPPSSGSMRSPLARACTRPRR
jgi:hypothetical protein